LVHINQLLESIGVVLKTMRTTMEAEYGAEWPAQKDAAREPLPSTFESR